MCVPVHTCEFMCISEPPLRNTCTCVQEFNACSILWLGFPVMHTPWGQVQVQEVYCAEGPRTPWWDEGKKRVRGYQGSTIGFYGKELSLSGPLWDHT